jgi:DNA-binding response OmpR family regulator
MDGKPRVLIVEDNVDLLEILEQLLSVDYSVATTRHGEEGIALATAFRPDVVILDLQLPGMGGIEAGLRIKRVADNVPILVLTALAGKGESEAVLASGCCDAYMAKPSSLDAIRAQVEQLLRSGAGTTG